MIFHINFNVGRVSAYITAERFTFVMNGLVSFDIVLDYFTADQTNVFLFILFFRSLRVRFYCWWSFHSRSRSASLSLYLTFFGLYNYFQHFQSTTVSEQIRVRWIQLEESQFIWKNFQQYTLKLSPFQIHCRYIQFYIRHIHGARPI